MQVRTRIRLRMRSLLEQGAAADDERRDADAYEGSRTPVVAVSLADRLLLFISYSSLAVSTRCSLPAGACRCLPVPAGSEPGSWDGGGRGQMRSSPPELGCQCPFR